jgi:hypothetical protein
MASNIIFIEISINIIFFLFKTNPNIPIENNISDKFIFKCLFIIKVTRSIMILIISIVIHSANDSILPRYYKLCDTIALRFLISHPTTSTLVQRIIFHFKHKLWQLDIQPHRIQDIWLQKQSLTSNMSSGNSTFSCAGSKVFYRKNKVSVNGSWCNACIVNIGLGIEDKIKDLTTREGCRPEPHCC